MVFGPGAALVADCVSEQGASEGICSSHLETGIIQASIELRLKQVVEFIYTTPLGCVTLPSQTNSGSQPQGLCWVLDNEGRGNYSQGHGWRGWKWVRAASVWRT